MEQTIKALVAIVTALAERIEALEEEVFGHYGNP